MSEFEEIPDRPSTILEDGKRRWIFPTEINGKWQKLRLVTSVTLLLLFYVAPWLTLEGVPFIRLSFLSSSFNMFGSHILIYEFYHFVLLALLLVTTLFTASALMGRVWCGYACPQTVFIEQILGRVDRLIEGPAAKRLLDSKRPMTLEKFFRKLMKQIVYVAICASFSFTLVAIFTGPELLLSGTSRAATLAIMILTAIAWFNAAYWREQFCHIVCPYARFQGVMQDASTITIGYDPFRGEPRGRAKLQTDQDTNAKHGDCIDCGLCVRVCPSGIDIRQGATQLECIACARCVDACDGIMTNIGKPTGLIRYDAVSQFEAVSPRPKKGPIIRTRIIAYGVAGTLIFGIGLYQYIARIPFHARAFSSAGAKPWFIEGEKVKNLALLKVGNQTNTQDSYSIKVQSNPEGLELNLESPNKLGPILPGQELTMPILISYQGQMKDRPMKAKILVKSLNSGRSYTIERPLVGPSQ